MWVHSCFGDGANTPISGGELWIEALQHQWHSRCFVCEVGTSSSSLLPNRLPHSLFQLMCIIVNTNRVKIGREGIICELLIRWTSPSLPPSLLSFFPSFSPSLSPLPLPLPLPPSLLNQVDFWSFGMVVFECVTGKRPFLHGDPAVAIGW